MRLGFEHTYADLPGTFYTRTPPAIVADPTLVLFNAPLAVSLGLDADTVQRDAAAMFSGKALPEDATPLAMAYAGHQFGHFNNQLGDGRAILLGELRGSDGKLHDIQLKGAGRTPWSRGGDGRAALGPMLREYLISEAMHALGIATTRSLAVVATGERVVRETLAPGAVLTRVAASHLRVGTFQYFSARNDQAALRELLTYAIARHYPQARAADVPALAFLELVAERQAELIARWMQVGFIHGVMNTDNMAISGETIDYGPCAFMDAYDPATVFSSIDRHGRYAYANQPTIAQWNLARLADTLLPLIDPDTDVAVRAAGGVIERFIDRFDAHFLAGMRRKIGLALAEDGDAALINALLTAMRDGAADFTLVFRRLGDCAESIAATPDFRGLFPAESPIDEWLRQWLQRLAREATPPTQRAAKIRRANPAFIPRNHRVEAALLAATEAGDLAPLRVLLDILQRPFQEQPLHAGFALPPAEIDPGYRTFCGT